MSKEFKTPQYTSLQLNSNIAYGLTKENNISKDELDSVQWLCEAYEHQIKQIADLEAKLAKNKKWLASNEGFLENQKLKQQLAEKEHSIEMLNQHITDKAIEIERLGEELEELKTENMNIFEYSKEVEQQLAEKDKQIKELLNYDRCSHCSYGQANKEYREKCSKLIEELAEKEDFIEDLMTGRVKPVIPRIKEIEKQDQDKISFAVEKLEKVKKFVIRQLFITTKDCSELDKAEAKGCNELREETIKEIDNQIKQLKEGK